MREKSSRKPGKPSPRQDKIRQSQETQKYQTTAAAAALAVSLTATAMPCARTIYILLWARLRGNHSKH